MMTAEMHRARHLAWELPKLGWDVTILAPDQTLQFPSYADSDSAAFFNPDVDVRLVSGSRGLFSRLRLRNIGLRTLVPAFWEIRSIICERKHDVVFFSTTQFFLFLLGPLVRALYKVSFVLDFHDPCFRDNFRSLMWTKASFKHKLNNSMLKYVERVSIGAAEGIITVSPGYLVQLKKRYRNLNLKWTHRGRNAAIPFAASARDFDVVSGHATKFTPSSEVVYIGAGGPIMERCFEVFCRALKRIRSSHPELVAGLKVRLLGTMGGWSNGGSKHLFNVACAYGLADVVDEVTSRVSFRRSLELLLGSDGALILGVDDAGYSPSKMFSYALSGKPLLAVVRQEGPAFAALSSQPELGHALWFRESCEIPEDEAAEVVRVFLAEVAEKKIFDRHEALRPFIAPSMAQAIAALFEACLTQENNEHLSAAANCGMTVPD